jgi:5-methyltetrahydropteroyltriglutamate--homocysteine methyltransferase
MADSDRILTTHVGSLPRPQGVVGQVFAEDKGEAIDRDEYERVIGAAVADRVQHRVDAGIDIVCDGEMSKIGYATFIRHRLYEHHEPLERDLARLSGSATWSTSSASSG